jgi:hypothetical protein
MLTTSGTYYIRILGLAAPTTNYAVESTVLKQSSGGEVEPNDTAAKAGTFDILGRVWGIIDVAGDVDQYSFQAKQNEVIRFEIFANDSTTDGGGINYLGTGSSLQEDLAVQDHAGTILARSSANQSTYAETQTTQKASLELIFVAPHTGKFYLVVRDQTGNGGANYWYMVEKK